jgi:hypothetical protein
MLSRRVLLMSVVVGSGLATIVSKGRAEEKPEDAAQQSALSWLALCDGGNYSGSYDQAAQYFKNAVKPDDWQHSMHAVRDPLGKVGSRKLKSATYKKSLPGAPDGEYVVIEFDTDFEHHAQAIETVTPMRESDGKWRVAGYFIK